MSPLLSILSNHWDDLLRGAVYTASLSLVSIVLGIFVGLTLCFGLISANPVIRIASKIYRSIWRGTPLLIQLLIIFYFLPMVGIDVPPLGAAIVALTMNTAAFQAEIYRGGLTAISKGQVEAARMLGISTFTIRKNILVPQMFRLVLPSLVNETISILKNSSLISVIAVTELLRTSQQVVATTYRPFEVYILAMLMYLIMTVSLAAVGRYFERHLSKSERKLAHAV
jgi:polar amino acid transport system permease protein